MAEIQERPPQPYAAVRATTSLARFADTVHASWPALFGWLEARGAALAGAPFIRYLGDGEEFDVEFGAPVAAAEGGGDERVRFGSLAGGRYATRMHRGPYSGLDANHAALREWAAAEGLELDPRCVEHYLDRGGEQRVELAYRIVG